MSRAAHARSLVVVAAVLWGAAAPSPAASAPTGASLDYIVVLKPGARSTDAVRHARLLGARISHVYRHALHGYSATLTEAALVAVTADARVDFVEPDRTMRVVATQRDATWGLDRIDQRSLPLSGSYTYGRTGSGVTAYIIDTGIRPSHEEFGGRASPGFDAIDGGPPDDCHGHGTHVAGTTGGATYGVAKGVRLVAVRVLDCGGTGSTSDVIAGVDWVTGDHDPGEPAVANMSLGGGVSTALDTAVRNSIRDGVGHAIAAGNGLLGLLAQDACGTSPARVTEAMTVSATDGTDRKASWANYGSCVDWFAPGVGITSAWHTRDTATNTISGTSMAAPHTTGIAALYLEGNPAASPDQVRQAIYDLTTKGIVARSSTPNNHLLFTNL